MLSLFLILEQNYKSIVIWTLWALYTLLIVCNGHSLVYTFIIQSLFSHHIIVKVISESIFIILGTWGREGLPLGCLMLQSIFQKKRHLVLGAAQEGLEWCLELVLVFSHPGKCLAAPCFGVCVLVACSLEVYVTNVCLSWGQTWLCWSSLPVTSAPTCQGSGLSNPDLF